MRIRPSLEQKGPMSVRLAAASCLPSVATECRWASSALSLRPASCGTSPDRPSRVAPGGRRPRPEVCQTALAKLSAGALPAPRQRRGPAGTSPRPSAGRSLQKAGRFELCPAGVRAFQEPRPSHRRRGHGAPIRGAVTGKRRRPRRLCGAMPAAGQWAPDGARCHTFSPGPARGQAQWPPQLPPSRSKAAGWVEQVLSTTGAGAAQLPVPRLRSGLMSS
jgi:hypothetical protein